MGSNASDSPASMGAIQLDAMRKSSKKAAHHHAAAEKHKQDPVSVTDPIFPA